MKLCLNQRPCRLEMGYELGFGPSVFEKMAEIVRAFPDAGEDVLFSYANWDRALEICEADVLLGDAKSFHADIVLDPDQIISQKVKEILLRHHAPGSEPRMHQSLMDRLLALFRRADFAELDEQLLLEMGTVVHQSLMTYTLEDLDEATQSFVKSRLRTCNSVWLWPDEKPHHLKNILWYRVNTIADIREALERTGWWFDGVIVSPDKDIEAYSYMLWYTEEHGLEHDEHDGMVLYIHISKEQEAHFRQTVLPRLQEILGDRLEVYL
ncbi:hypothetical protein B5M42_011350 [Paenibacillus athensensis]|uniref:Uncharacterized protein n=1 Tax=Paenibacillus athensensis TaxID=1967502 RepID=A0A4Y8PWS4_9BACL|nr:hypothetical protein [Paenibacillus athensensis]MCD1259430.1 hypothetical protein [Paenibacillus athensensis]